MHAKEEQFPEQSILRSFFPKERRQIENRTLTVTLPSIELSSDKTPDAGWMTAEGTKTRRTLILQPIAYRKMLSTSRQPYFAILHYDSNTQESTLIGSPINTLDRRNLLNTLSKLYPQTIITFKSFPSSRPFSYSVENIGIFAARIANGWEIDAAMDTTDVINTQSTCELIRQHYQQMNKENYADYLLKQSLSTENTSTSIEWIANNVVSQFEEVLKGGYDLDFMIEAIIERQSIYYNGEKCSNKNLSKDNIVSVLSELETKYDSITMASRVPLNPDGSINTEGYTLHDPNRLKVILDMDSDQMLRCNLSEKLLIESIQFKLISNTGLDQCQVKTNVMLNDLIQLGLLSNDGVIDIQEALQTKIKTIKTDLRTQLRDNYLVIQDSNFKADWVQINSSPDHTDDGHSLLSRIKDFLKFKHCLESAKEQPNSQSEQSNQTELHTHARQYFQDNMANDDTWLSSLLAAEIIDVFNEKKELIHLHDTASTLNDIILDINSYYHISLSINDDNLENLVIESTHHESSNQKYFLYEAIIQRPILLLKKSGLNDETIKNMPVSDIILYSAAMINAVKKTCDDYNNTIDAHDSNLDEEIKHQQFKHFEKSLYAVLGDEIKQKLIEQSDYSTYLRSIA